MSLHFNVIEGNYTYESLRKVALDKASQEDSIQWLEILECGVMMHDTTDDLIMDQLNNIPLWLQDHYEIYIKEIFQGNIFFLFYKSV